MYNINDEVPLTGTQKKIIFDAVRRMCLVATGYTLHPHGSLFSEDMNLNQDLNCNLAYDKQTPIFVVNNNPFLSALQLTKINAGDKN